MNLQALIGEGARGHQTPVDGGKLKSPHNLEIPLVFDNAVLVPTLVGEGVQVQRLADAMSSSWVSFARTGTPGWGPYEPTQRLTMVFNITSKVISDPEREERQLFGSVPAVDIAVLRPRG